MSGFKAFYDLEFVFWFSTQPQRGPLGASAKAEASMFDRSMDVLLEPAVGQFALAFPWQSDRQSDLRLNRMGNSGSVPRCRRRSRLEIVLLFLFIELLEHAMNAGLAI